MQYEIKNISLSSVLKMSFLTLMTTGTIFFTFSTLFILRMVNSVSESLEEVSELGIGTITNMSLGGIFATSFFMGIFISLLLVFWISLIIIFYNFFAKYLGGIVMEFKEKS